MTFLPKVFWALTVMCWGRRGTLTFCWRWSLRVWWLVLCRSRMIGDGRTPPTSSGCIPALASCRYVASYHSLPLSEWKESSKKKKKTYELKIKHEKRIRKVNGFIIFGCKACLEDEKWLSKKGDKTLPGSSRKFDVLRSTCLSVLLWRVRGEAREVFLLLARKLRLSWCWWPRPTLLSWGERRGAWCEGRGEGDRDIELGERGEYTGE